MKISMRRHRKKLQRKLATYEILLDEQVPRKVAINEAVELAKKYCNEKAAPFINGVLSKIGQDMDEE